MHLSPFAYNIVARNIKHKRHLYFGDREQATAVKYYDLINRGLMPVASKIYFYNNDEPIFDVDFTCGQCLANNEGAMHSLGIRNTLQIQIQLAETLHEFECKRCGQEHIYKEVKKDQNHPWLDGPHYELFVAQPEDFQ